MQGARAPRERLLGKRGRARHHGKKKGDVCWYLPSPRSLCPGHTQVRGTAHVGAACTLWPFPTLSGRATVEIVPLMAGSPASAPCLILKVIRALSLSFIDCKKEQKSGKETPSSHSNAGNLTYVLTAEILQYIQLCFPLYSPSLFFFFLNISPHNDCIRCRH